MAAAIWRDESIRTSAHKQGESVSEEGEGTLGAGVFAAVGGATGEAIMATGVAVSVFVLEGEEKKG